MEFNLCDVPVTQRWKEVYDKTYLGRFSPFLGLQGPEKEEELLRLLW